MLILSFRHLWFLSCWPELATFCLWCPYIRSLISSSSFWVGTFQPSGQCLLQSHWSSPRWALCSLPTWLGVRFGLCISTVWRSCAQWCFQRGTILSTLTSAYVAISSWSPRLLAYDCTSSFHQVLVSGDAKRCSCADLTGHCWQFFHLYLQAFWARLE